MKSHKQFSLWRSTLQSKLDSSEQSENGINRTTLMSISFGPLYDVMSSQSSGMCCLPVCGHHFLPAQEIVIRLCEAYVQKHTRHRGAAVLVFPLGIKGICLAWGFNHAPSHRRI